MNSEHLRTIIKYRCVSYRKITVHFVYQIIVSCFSEDPSKIIKLCTVIILVEYYCTQLFSKLNFTFKNKLLIQYYIYSVI